MNSKKMPQVLVRRSFSVLCLVSIFSFSSFAQNTPAVADLSRELSCLNSLNEARQQGWPEPSAASYQVLRGVGQTDNVSRDFPAVVLTAGNRISVLTPSGIQNFTIPNNGTRQSLYIVPIPGMRETFDVPAQGGQPAAACRDPRSVVAIKTTGSGPTRRVAISVNNTSRPELLVQSAGGNERCTSLYESLNIEPSFANLTNLIRRDSVTYLSGHGASAERVLRESPQASQAFVRGRISAQVAELARNLQRTAVSSTSAIIGNGALMRPVPYDPVPNSVFVSCALSPALNRQLAAIQNSPNRRLQQLFTHNEITLRRRNAAEAGRALPSGSDATPAVAAAPAVRRSGPLAPAIEVVPLGPDRDQVAPPARGDRNEVGVEDAPGNHVPGAPGAGADH